MVCAETNKKFDVMSTALENEDRDFVTEDDLRAGNELVWVKNNNRLTVAWHAQKPVGLLY